MRLLDSRAFRLDVFADESDYGIQRGARAEDGGDALILQKRHILIGNRAAQNDQDVCGIALSEQSSDAGNDGIVGAGKDAQSDAIHVFLDRRVDDHFRGLAQAGVDHFHPGIPQGPGNHFGATIMTVETGLCDENANGGGALSHMNAEG